MALIDTLKRLSEFNRAVAADFHFVLEHLIHYGYIDQGVQDEGPVEQVTAVYQAMKTVAAQLGILLKGNNLEAVTQLARVLSRCSRCAIKENDTQAATAKWHKTTLNWYLDATPHGFTRDQMSAVIQQSLASWTAVTNMNFAQVDNAQQADLVYSIGSGPKDQFDGAGGTLAWAFLPTGNDAQLLMRFDDAESFSETKGQGIYIYCVSTHESGHLLGLQHAPNATSLMSPYYNVNISVPQQWDQASIQALYGPPVASPAPAPAPAPLPPTGTTPTIPDGYIRAADIVLPGYMIVKSHAG